MVELKNVSKTFGKKEARVEALRGIDLSIREGELVAIMGKSGSGKSTLLNILGTPRGAGCRPSPDRRSAPA